MPKNPKPKSCILNAQILELRWEHRGSDHNALPLAAHQRRSLVDDARHAAIYVRIVTNPAGPRGVTEWTALFYDHPANSWQVVELNTEKWTAPDTNGDSDRVHFDSLSDPEAAEEFERLAGTIVTTEPLDRIADDLYEYGRRGANRRWKKRHFALVVDPAVSSGEVRHD